MCEDIAAPEELASVQALRDAGIRVQTVWQSTLLAPNSLPFAPEQVPDTFTVFRQQLEHARVQAPAPLPVPRQLPPLPPAELLARADSAMYRAKQSTGQRWCIFADDDAALSN